MTETELVLGSLTPEELDDARRFVKVLEDGWLTQSKGLTPIHRIGLNTDGPSHLLTAMKLAVLREMAARGGAEPWYAGMPTDGHIAGRLIDLYGRRYGYRELEPRPNPSGQLERVCAVCGATKVQSLDNFDRGDGLWSDVCRTCRRIDVTAIPPDALDVPLPAAAATAPIEIEADALLELL